MSPPSFAYVTLNMQKSCSAVERLWRASSPQPILKTRSQPLLTGCLTSRSFATAAPAATVAGTYATAKPPATTADSFATAQQAGRSQAPTAVPGYAEVGLNRIRVQHAEYDTA